MFKGQSIFEIISAGGFTIYILIFCSIISVAVIIERVVYYKRRSQFSRAVILDQIRKEFAGHHVLNAIGLCKNIDTPVAKVALAGLNLHGHDEKLIANAMEREITVETIKLERFIGIVGSIGGTAVYIGLLGTVMGIMRAFSDISKAGSGGMDVVTVGIAEALVCTVAGLLVAIPAVLSYNWFTRKIDNFVVDMELAASELVDLMCVKKRMRQRQRNSKLIAEINIAPFTDVILVLLIVFMVTTPLIYRSSIKIALPQVSNNQQPLESKDINVSITSAGEVYLNNERYNLKLDLDIFKFKLKHLMKTYNDPAIIINGDRNVKYDYVVQVIDAASKAGIKHLVLATEFKR